MNPPDSKRKLKYKMKNLIVPSGIDKELFQKDYEIQREPKRMCWTCKYDNGLSVVLKHFWPEILKKHPESEFHIYYGFNGIDENLKKEIEPLLLQDGVTHHGRVNHEEIAKEYQRSSFLFYYTATPNECDCVSVMEALASGCIPILWNKNVFSCFHGLLSPDIPMDLNSFTKLASKVSELMEKDNERNKVIEKFKRSDTIISNEAAANIFISAFEGKSQIAEVQPDKTKPAAPMQNVTNNVSNAVPSGINLQNYVDSDSDSDEESNKPKANINLQNYVDSDSDVEYESDSEDEQEKRNRLAQAEEDMVDRELAKEKLELAKEKLEDFVSSETFKGSKFGYIFKNGEKGIGYYKDKDLSEVKKVE